MIEFARGDILGDGADALVNTVNCVGVMGKGIALAFRNAYPRNFALYREECAAGRLRPGCVFVTETGELFGPKYILNAATKDHWRDPSRTEWARSCAEGIARLCGELGLESVAVPALGCSNGGLSWSVVRPALVEALSDVPARVRLYEPFGG